MNMPSTLAAVAGVCIGIVGSILSQPRVMSDQALPEQISIAASTDSNDAEYQGALARHAKRLQQEADANRQARQRIASVQATEDIRSQTTMEPGWSRLIAATSTPPTTVLEKSVGESGATTRGTMGVWGSISTSALGILGKAAEAVTAIAGAQPGSSSNEETKDETNDDEKGKKKDSKKGAGKGKPDRNNRTSGRMTI
ncbi:MAG: hypothetical protein JSS49_27985 [Planctomycetes bacterium]|nr:hypothetical protein [Planctomycetota bacterium]